MTVEELIKVLQNCENQKAQVYVAKSGDIHIGDEAFGVTEVASSSYIKPGVYIEGE